MYGEEVCIAMTDAQDHVVAPQRHALENLWGHRGMGKEREDLIHNWHFLCEQLELLDGSCWMGCISLRHRCQ